MSRRVVVHSNAKRFVQVAGTAILIAGVLTGLKKASNWWKEDQGLPLPAAEASAIPIGREISSAIVEGRASVIDADTLEIQGIRIRLEGIDAPESTQHCGAAGQDWKCGREASAALGNWLGDRPLTCNPKGHDRYGRSLARCFVGSEDVQAWLVLNGWALAYRQYSTDYVAAEEVAQARKAGLWRSEFIAPWNWRGDSREP